MEGEETSMPEMLDQGLFLRALLEALDVDFVVVVLEPSLDHDHLTSSSG
jgi:hypothetical protein